MPDSARAYGGPGITDGIASKGTICNLKHAMKPNLSQAPWCYCLATARYKVQEQVQQVEAKAAAHNGRKSLTFSFAAVSAVSCSGLVLLLALEARFSGTQGLCNSKSSWLIPYVQPASTVESPALSHRDLV